MTDLFLIVMAVVNALLLLAFYRILHVNPEAKNKMFYFQFNDGLDHDTGPPDAVLRPRGVLNAMDCRRSPHRGRHPDHNTEIPETPPAFAVIPIYNGGKSQKIPPFRTTS